MIPSRIIFWLFGCWGTLTAMVWIDVAIWWQFAIMVGFYAAADLVARFAARSD